MTCHWSRFMSLEHPVPLDSPLYLADIYVYICVCVYVYIYMFSTLLCKPTSGWYIYTYMYMSVCVCVYILIHYFVIKTQIYICVRVFVCKSSLRCDWKPPSDWLLYTCVYVHMYVCVYVCMYTGIYVFTTLWFTTTSKWYMCVCVCVCVCVCTYIYYFPSLIPVYPPDPKNHITIFKGLPCRLALWELVPD